MTHTKSQRERVVARAMSLALLVALFPVAAMGQPPSPLEEAKLVGDERISTPYGEIEIEHNFITAGSQELFDALDFQRACQAYIWATPAVSYKQWRVAQAETFDARRLGDFVVYKTLKEKRGIVTANLTTTYVVNFLTLADGAIKVKVPAGAIAGMFLDLWQRPVCDIGQTGPDQGEGGSYIIVGPEEDKSKYEGKADYVYQSETNNIFIGLRLLDPSPAFEERIRKELNVARVGEEYRPIRFIKNVDKEWSATAPRGLGFWELLSAIYQEEPTREQDKAFAAMLEPLGIQKGKAFKPDERQKRILLQGAAMGELMLRNLQTNPRFAEPYWSGTYWYKSFDFTVPQITEEKVELDERALWFYEAVTSSEGMVNPTLGKGQVYMTTKRDSNGELLRADETYKLTVPRDVPVAQFWSVTLYSENTRRAYDNGGTSIASTSLDSKMKQLQYNEDGSVDLYIGAKAPKGMESNFLKTVGKDGWFIYFRLYAPLQPFFDKTFSLPDFERIDSVEIDTLGSRNDSIPVTAENYVQAETDWNFAAQQAQAPINTWTHKDRVTEENQTIIRSNADVAYSLALVDVSEGATFSIPKRENGKLQLIHYMDENHLTHGVVYAGDSVTVTPDDLTGGHYVYILARTQISQDLDETKAAQRSMVIDAKSAKPYQPKGFDPKEVEAFREKLIAEVNSGKVAIDGFRAFGATLDDVVYKDYYYASALGWAGLPPQHAQYTAFVKGQGSAAKGQTITFPKPKLDYENGGFFSLTTYNSESWIEGDNFYIGHERMKDNGDGTMTIDFNCDTPHSVTVGEGWNGTFRLYKPIDVEETRKAVDHLITIDIQMK